MQEPFSTFFQRFSKILTSQRTTLLGQCPHGFLMDSM